METDRDRLAAFYRRYLQRSATHPDGRSITVREFALYRLEGDQIAAVWGDLDKDRLVAL